MTERPAISPNQWTILEALKDGPRWSRTFQTVKPLYEDLVARGMIERCRPHLGRGKNMLRLTEAGCVALEIDPANVPAKRDEPKPNSKAYTPPVLGAIQAGVTSRCRLICEAFVRGISAGELSRTIVSELAARFDVQRPAIWKALRVGGVLAPYAPRQDGGAGRPLGGGEPGYTEHRRERSVEVAIARRPEFPPEQFVDRDPCPRCGVRGDIGCSHSRAPIGMML